MNIYVVLKQVPDTETKIRLSSDQNGIDTGGIKWIVSPYDEFAIEEGLKTKETLKAGTVTVLTVGPERCIEALRTALAMGADNAIHVKADTSDTYLVGRALAESLKKENPDIILMGKQAIDDDQAATFHYVAEFLDVPSVTRVTKIELSDDKKTAKVHQESDGGSKNIVETSLPAVIAVDKGINSPRYASLPGIMKAKKKEIKGFTLSDLSLDGEGERCMDSDFKLPPERQAGKKIEGDTATQVSELVRLLREEAKVL